MATRDNVQIAPADGKLGVLIPGIGAVSTTFIAGVEAVKRGTAAPIGSLTQLSTIRLGKRTDDRSPMIKDFVPLAGLNDLVFGGWDIYEDTAYEAAVNAKVLERSQLDELKAPLSAIKPMKAVFDSEYIRRINGPNVKEGKTKMDKAEMLLEDIEQFRKTNNTARNVMIWCGSTEVFHRPAAVHKTLKDFECGLMQNDPEIAPSQIYAYAALKSGIPFANGAPNLTTDTPALQELARERNVPICGKDFKTGQTFMKTLIAPGLKARMLGISGWFSTNILGNRDGEVLEDPGSFKTKEETKLSSLECRFFSPSCIRSFTRDLYHAVRINYYPPAAAIPKKAGDNIDIFGWLNYPMQIKIDFPCGAATLHFSRASGPGPGSVHGPGAAPVRHARHPGMRSPFYFAAAPMTAPGLYPDSARC